MIPVRAALTGLLLAAMAPNGALAQLCDILFEVPAEAKGELRSHEPRSGRLDGGRPDCWVFGVEPGDEVSVQVTSRAFAPAIDILPEPVCDGAVPQYSDRGGRRAEVVFEAPRNAFGVVVSSAAPGGSGAYSIVFRQEAAGRPGAPDRTPSEPERLVRSLYRGGGPDLTDPAVIDRVLAPVTAEALKRLQADSRGVGLGFDPLVDGQDSDITRPRISVRVWLATSALIDVRFRNFGQPVHLVFHMRETAAGWRVEDIESRGPDNEQHWVLSRLLGLDLGVAAARQ